MVPQFKKWGYHTTSTLRTPVNYAYDQHNLTTEIVKTSVYELRMPLLTRGLNGPTANIRTLSDIYCHSAQYVTKVSGIADQCLTTDHHVTSLVTR